MIKMYFIEPSVYSKHNIEIYFKKWKYICQIGNIYIYLPKE